MEDSIVYGFGTSGWIGLTAVFMSLKSWTKREEPLGVFTAKIGVL